MSSIQREGGRRSKATKRASVPRRMAAAAMAASAPARNGRGTGEKLESRRANRRKRPRRPPAQAAVVITKNPTAEAV